MLSQKTVKLFLIFLAASFTGCSDEPKESATQELASEEAKKYSDKDVNLYALNKLVCDPFGGDIPPTEKSGLKAELFYLDSSLAGLIGVDNYIAQGIFSEKTLFFSTLNVPTRYFTQGFPSETGELVKKDSGEELVEWFGLRFKSVLKLAEGQQEGVYELALISDDGAKMKYRDQDGVWQVLVDNDGTHSPKMGCSAVTLEMTKDTEIMIEYTYYQGPRNAIAMVPIWRIANPATLNKDPRCGQQGNRMYWDRDNNSAPMPAWNELVSRGWKVIDAANYQLPQEALFNPCVEGTMAKITNFTVEDNHDGVVIVEWDTNIETTSQVKYKDLSTGVETLTVSDNVLRTHHKILIRNLPVDRSYTFQGVSISNDYGKAISAPTTIAIQ